MPFVEPGSILNQADAEKRQWLDAQLLQLSAALLSQTPPGIDESLGVIGEAVGVCRAYVFLFTADGKHCSNTHEWCSPGITPQIANLQDCDLAPYGWWLDQLSSGPALVIEDVAAIPFPERAMLEAQDVRSLIAVRVDALGPHGGFVGFDDTKRLRRWTAEEIRALRLTAGMIAGHMALRQALEDKGEALSRLQATLEATADGILVVDRSGRVTDTNRRFGDIWRLPEEVRRIEDGEAQLRAALPLLEDPESFYRKAVELMNGDPLAETADEVVLADGRVLERTSRPQQIDGAPVGRVWSFRDITAARAAERRLREQAAALASTSDGLAIVGPDRRLANVNPAHAQLYGYTSPESLLGLNWESLYEPAEAARLRALAAQGFANRGWWAGRATGRRRDGSVFPQEISLTLLPDGGIVCVVRDVTERLEQEERLRRSEEHYRLMVEGSESVFFYVHDRSGRLEYVSPSVVAVLGYEAAELVGRDYTDVLADEPGRDAVLAATERSLAGLEPAGSYVAPLKHRDGHTLWVEITESPLVTGGEVRGLQGFARDVTERRLLEERLRQGEKLEAIGRLAGGIAHDFNNILTVISGTAELISEELHDADHCRDQLGQLRSAAGRAALLTQQLLAFGRKQMVAPRALSANSFVGEFRELIRRMLAGAAALEVRLAAENDLLLADPVQLEQVLLNLVANARDAMPAGGVLTLETDDAVVDAERAARENVQAGRFVRLSVRDTGGGIPLALQSRVFELFFTTKEMGKGTGLGLASVYGIVRQNQGFIELESSPSGTSFHCFFPLADEVERGETSRPLRRRILLAEDEPAVRQLVTTVLRRRGYEVASCEDGAEALEILRSGRRFELLLTDVMMPRMRGPELVGEARRICAGLPVLLMSGFSEAPVDWSLVSDPRTGFIEKPFTPDELVRRVQGFLGDGATAVGLVP